MLEAIKQHFKQHYSRPVSIFRIDRENVKGAFYWYSVFTLCDHAGLPDTFTGVVASFILGFPLYVWLFHTEEEESKAV